MLKPTRKREVFVVMVAVLAIATSFAFLVAQMFKAPRRGQETQSGMTAPEDQQRSPETTRMFGRRLSVHKPGESSSSTSKSDRAASHGVFVPDKELVSDSTSISAFNNFTMPSPVMPSRPPRRVNASDENADQNDEDQQFSGWGWLFDDIKSSRANRASREDGDQDQAMLDDEENEKRDAIARRSSMGGDDVFFVPGTGMRDSSAADVLRPVFADQANTRERPQRTGDMDRKMTGVDGLPLTDDASRRPTASPELRDPFAGASRDRASDNVALLRPTRAEDVFFRGRDNLPIPTRESYIRNAGGATDARPASALNISAMPASTRPDWSISASSDRAFSSPAGYGSAGARVGAADASAFSSMPSSFGGGSAFSSPSAIGSGTAPGSFMDRNATPSPGFSSGFGGGVERPGPSALPW